MVNCCVSTLALLLVLLSGLHVHGSRSSSKLVQHSTLCILCCAYAYMRIIIMHQCEAKLLFIQPAVYQRWLVPAKRHFLAGFSIQRQGNASALFMEAAVVTQTISIPCKHVWTNAVRHQVDCCNGIATPTHTPHIAHLNISVEIILKFINKINAYTVKPSSYHVCTWHLFHFIVQIQECCNAQLNQSTALLILVSLPLVLVDPMQSASAITVGVAMPDSLIFREMNWHLFAVSTTIVIGITCHSNNS